VRPEAIHERKIPMTSSGVELATIWLIGQGLNQLRHCVDFNKSGEFKSDVNISFRRRALIADVIYVYCFLLVA
jgi:hypothetical protein